MNEHEIDKMWERFYNQDEPKRQAWLERNHLRLTKRGELVLTMLAYASVIAVGAITALAILH